MSATIQMRRGTAESATASNPILKEGEWGLETDTTFYKIGDGVTTWNSLPYGGVQGIPGAGEALAVGFISMFSGTWVDNTTMPGWYACIAANSGQGCPDLENQFVKGSAPADVGDTGGSATHTLVEAELPAHDHTSAAHSHTMGTHKHYSGTRTFGTYVSSLLNGYAAVSSGPSVSINSSNSTVSGYTQTVDPGDTNSTTPGNTGNTGSGTAHNNEPQYYKLIFIRKCR